MRKNKKNGTPSARVVVESLLENGWNYAKAAIKDAKKSLPGNPALECFSGNGRSVYLSNEFNKCVIVPLQRNVAPGALSQIKSVSGLEFD